MLRFVELKLSILCPRCRLCSALEAMFGSVILFAKYETQQTEYGKLSKCCSSQGS